VTAATVRDRLSDESGLTLSEMLVVLVILGVVLAALTGLFVSAMRTEVDQAKRFQAQQEARLALDGLRREVHCAEGISPSAVAGYPATSITITLGAYCSSTPSGGPVTWCTVPTSGAHALWRTPGTACTPTGGVKKADHLTAGAVFTNLATGTPGSNERAKLSVDLPVDADPTTTSGLYRLQDDIVLRNSARS